MRKISIFGLGYVGCVSLGCLSELGFEVVGVDVNEFKVNLINSGLPTIVEKDIDKIIKSNYDKKRISATIDYKRAVVSSDVSFICVGTPSLPTGQLNLEYVFNAARQIAEGLHEKNSFHVVAIRSTVFPGTNEKVADIIEEISGKAKDIDFAVVSNPEFLREGSAVDDYFNPAITVIGGQNTLAIDQLKEIYSHIKAPIVITSIRTAEIIKYINNTFHALKISFANEVGNICKALDIDPFEVMDIFKMDHRLNISSAYLNPGMAYGGSCLPKDLKGLVTIAHDNYIRTPVIEAISESNRLQQERVFDIIAKQNLRKIGIYGLAFKKGTDDLRYSPLVALAEVLLGKGYDIKIYDKFVHISKLIGSNKSYIEQHLPHISALLRDSLMDVLDDCEILVVGHSPDETDYTLLKTFSKPIIDLVRLDTRKFSKHNIIGVSW